MEGMRLRPELLYEKCLLQETIIACLVGQLGETRISQAELEFPPDIEEDDDPITGDWIYRVKSPGPGSPRRPERSLEREEE